jgi:FkbM family methyltransferase
MPRPSTTPRFADLLARVFVRWRPLERLLVFACRRPLLRRRLHVGAIAIGYTRVLGSPEIRLARLDGYSMFVSVAEHLGNAPYFFGDSGAAWLTGDLIEPGGVYVDAGANIGHYTFFIASRIGPHGRVTSFEPNPVYADLLRRSIEQNGFAGRVSVEPRALWEKTGETLTFYLSNDASNSGLSSLILQGGGLSRDHATKVETVAFDDWAREHSIAHVRLLKIDVERAEHQVIKGMNVMLRDARIDYLIVELLAHGEAHAALDGHGYACFRIDAERRKLVAGQDVPPETFGDYLCVSRGSMPEFLGKFSSSIARADGDRA